MPNRPALDLSKIYRAPVLRTTCAYDAQHELALQLTPHDLRWGRGEIMTSLYRRELSRISLLILHYGAEVEIKPEAFEDFALVQMPLRGSTEIECEGMNIRVSPGEIAVVPPRRNVRLFWEADCEQLILRLPQVLLKPDSCASCPVSARGEDRWSCAKWVDPVYKIEADIAEQWLGLLQQIVSLLPAEGPPTLHPAWINRFEQTAALFLQAHQPSMRKAAPGGDALACRSSDCPQVDRLEAYIRSRLFAPLALADLAQAAGVTPRTLNALCQRHRGVAPMTLVRNLRLDAARHKLLSGAARSVTQVALENGFEHLGRFSSYYRERFGELPRNTGCGLHGLQ